VFIKVECIRGEVSPVCHRSPWPRPPTPPWLGRRANGIYPIYFNVLCSIAPRQFSTPHLQSYQQAYFVYFYSVRKPLSREAVCQYSFSQCVSRTSPNIVPQYCYDGSFNRGDNIHQRERGGREGEREREPFV